MALTPAQQTALAADIAADPAFADLPHNSDGAFAIAAAYNLPAVPDFTVWKTNVPTHDVKGALVWTEYLDTSVADKMTFELMISNGELDASDVNVRQGIADVFSGPQAAGTRDALIALAKELATRAEALLATGDGTQASPGTRTFTGNLSYRDVEEAMGW